MLPTTLEAAVRAGTKLYFDGSTCSNGHTAPRRWSRSTIKGVERITTKCEECRKANRAANRHKDRATHNRSVINGVIGRRLRGVPARKPTKADRLLGLPVPDYIKWLERQFEPGWTWENWGTIWQIDHIKACHHFDLTDEKQVLQCFHYTNTRPLARESNEWRG